MSKDIFNAIMRKIYFYMSYAYYSISLGQPTNAEKNNINDLRNNILRLSPITCDSDKESENEWLSYRVKLRKSILRQDPRLFLKWDVIRKTMFVSNADYIFDEFSEIGDDPRWISAINEVQFGCPDRYSIYNKSSANLIHHAYSLYAFEKKMSFDISSFDFVFEFGGGYGSMCRLFHNRGFTGKYLIHDLPEFCHLQEYFLKSIGMPYNQQLSEVDGISSIYDIQVLTNCLSKTKTGNSLYVATWSLSETPELLRNNLFTMLPDFDSYLIAFQDTFNEVNNVKYFNEFAETQVGYTWTSFEIPHLKNNYYLFGTRLKL